MSDQVSKPLIRVIVYGSREAAFQEANVEIIGMPGRYFPTSPNEQVVVASDMSDLGAELGKG